jgi:hypothetical protein
MLGIGIVGLYLQIQPKKEGGCSSKSESFLEPKPGPPPALISQAQLTFTGEALSEAGPSQPTRVSMKRRNAVQKPNAISSASGKAMRYPWHNVQDSIKAYWRLSSNADLIYSR